MAKNISSNNPTIDVDHNGPKRSIMEELLASQSKKLITLYRGQNIEGEVILITDKDIILELGAKSEGILPKRGLPDSQIKNLKVGDKIKAYVSIPENENGQTLLSFEKAIDLGRPGGKFGKQFGQRGGKSIIDWSKFQQAQAQKAKLKGNVTEINKGGLIVEVFGVRGFLPYSQIGFELLSKAGGGMEDLIGEELGVTVIEVDAANNKLIFSERGQVSEEVKKNLSNFKVNEKVAGKIVAILPFGLVIDINGSEGLIFISDVSWEKVEDLSKMFKTGEEIKVLITGLDEELGRLNLSIKGLSEDPFAKLAEEFPADEVVKGEITEVSEAGILVQLDGAEGFLPASKIESSDQYEVGKSMSFLVDSVDSNKRRINLAPFVTSTAGLIYK